MSKNLFIDEGERKVSECEKRTSLSADMEEPDIGIHPVPRRQPNRVSINIIYI